MAPRWSWAIACAVGCFSPTPPTGLACGEGGACPSGQSCSASNVCEPGGGSGGGIDGGIDAPLVDGATGDAATFTVHVSIGVTRIQPGSAATVELAGSALLVALADGTTPALAVEADGSIDFTRAAADQAYSIDVPSSVPIGGYAIVAATPELSYAPPVFGRANPAPVTEATNITVDEEGSDANVGTSIVLTTGVRAFKEENGGGSATSFTVNWQLASVFSGPVPLIESSLGDMLWIFHYASVASPSEVFVDTAISKVANMIDGGGTSTTTTLAAQTIDCAQVSAPIAADSARLASAVGSAVASELSIVSQPSEVAGAAGGYAVAIASSPAAAASYRYSLPLPDEVPLALTTFAATVNRTGGGATSGFSATALLESAAAIPTVTACAQPAAVTVAAAPPLATKLQIDGVALTADQQVISLAGSDSATITAAFDAPFVGDELFQLAIDEVTQGALGGVVEEIQASPQFVVPASLFKAGATYVVTITTWSGYPNAASGDWVTRSSSVGQAAMPSHTFSIE